MRLDKSRPRAYTDIGEVDWRAMSGSFRVQVPVNQKLLSLNMSECVMATLVSTFDNQKLPNSPFLQVRILNKLHLNLLCLLSSDCPSAGELLVLFFRQNIHRKSIIKPTTNRRSLCDSHNLYAHHLRHRYNICHLADALTPNN
jgi:hypothetical protein